MSTATTGGESEALQRAATEARGLAIDAVHACSSGHLGLPLGCAEMGAVLFGEALRFYPGAPKWLNRDRFILSAGHGSMFLYGWLHLAGYEISMEALQDFRQLHSGTPGHPEFGETPGVEATTGPLGQGVGNAVGFAISGKRAAARFNTAGHVIFDHHVVTLAGDGCMQEGVAREALAFAGHGGLDNLILIYDCNEVTLDAMSDVTQSEDAEKYFEALGWEARTVDGHDMACFREALQAAKERDNGKPKVLIAKTVVGKGIPEVAGTSAAHGEAGAKFAAEARRGLGLPEEAFHVSRETRDFFAGRVAELRKEFEAWEATYAAWEQANPELAAELQAGVAKMVPSDLMDRIPEFPDGYLNATRGAGGVVINAVAQEMPQLVTGSADLFGSTKNYLAGEGDFARDNPAGRNIWFGIREHAMGAICNGIAYDGIFRASGATFLVFADYLRPAIRLASLAGLPVVYIFTHDSVGVGEDGPTHQPVETVSGLRVIPNLDVIRPADPEETAGAWTAALMRHDGPTALILTRQKVPTMGELPVRTRREGTYKGAYVARAEKGPLEAVLIASGSEVAVALEAARELGDGVRVVSMPSHERFDRQSPEYRDQILPASCTKRVAIEAGVTGLWWKYAGPAGRVIGIERFGLSAPGNTVMRELGITKEAVAAAVREL